MERQRDAVCEPAELSELLPKKQVTSAPHAFSVWAIWALSGALNGSDSVKRQVTYVTGDVTYQSLDTSTNNNTDVCE